LNYSNHGPVHLKRMLTDDLIISESSILIDPNNHSLMNPNKLKK